jgi:hypothetical protein
MRSGVATNIPRILPFPESKRLGGARKLSLATGLEGQVDVSTEGKSWGK